MTPKKVFISYAWEDENFSDKILAFANKLRANGIDANIDQYEENPDMGWPIWMENQIETSDYVLVVSTKAYMDKFRQQQMGKGVSWEISLIYQSLYNLRGHNDKFIPVLLNDNDDEFVIGPLQPYTKYNIYTQFDKLKNRIKGITNTIKPPITDSPLPEKHRQSIFVASPIDIELWDKAKWRGVAYLNVSNSWAIAFIFEGDCESAVKIFQAWKKTPNIDDYLSISFIEGEIENLPPNGYTCLIAPNVKKSIERISNIDNAEQDPIIITITRFQRMYPSDNFKLYNLCKDIFLRNKGVAVPILPMTMNNPKFGLNPNNLLPHWNETIFIKNINYINAKNIKKTDLESIVIPKYQPNFPEFWKVNND